MMTINTPHRFELHHLTPLAELLNEAAGIIRSMNREEFDRLKVRHWLCDELQGSALILKDLLDDSTKNRN